MQPSHTQTSKLHRCYFLAAIPLYMQLSPITVHWGGGGIRLGHLPEQGQARWLPDESQIHLHLLREVVGGCLHGEGGGHGSEWEGRDHRVVLQGWKSGEEVFGLSCKLSCRGGCDGVTLPAAVLSSPGHLHAWHSPSPFVPSVKV